MRCDIRYSAEFFIDKNFVDTVEANYYTWPNTRGRFKEHRIEVAGTTLEAILGLGAIYEHKGYAEFVDMPEIVAMIEMEMKSRPMRAHRREARDYINR